MSIERAVVRTFVPNGDKITQYLLSRPIRATQGKADFFLGFGFSLDRSDGFGRALLNPAAPERFVRATLDVIGAQRLTYEGPPDAPMGVVPASERSGRRTRTR